MLGSSLPGGHRPAHRARPTADRLVPVKIAGATIPILLSGAALTVGCSGPVQVDNPYATLTSPGENPRRQLGAMVALDADPDDPEYLKALEGVIWKPGYTAEIRRQAMARLEQDSLEDLQRTLRQRLPPMSARQWQEELCGIIADRGWVELTPALVSAWSHRIGFVDDLDRAEYLALVRLHGQDHVVDAVFDVMVSSDKAYQQALRGRCWELLVRIGQRQRLVELLADQSVGPDDGMLIDLRAAAVDLRVVPQTREEILWIRKIHEPEHAAFWSQAAQVVAGLPPQRLEELELREVPILVAASIHDPQLLDASKEDLLTRLREHVAATRQHVDPDRFQGIPGTYPQRLGDYQRTLTWGDLAAMLIAVRAVQVPQVVDHLLDYAQRDLEDESCEYGGVISLDDRGRFEILEFPPRFRRSDQEFIASQQMFDAGYTAVFHFHNHAQRHRNGRYACPGVGDLNYADNVRANCLVFTFINDSTMNMDFYRHGHVIVDLGEVTKSLGS